VAPRVPAELSDASILAGALFSVWGDGASTRAATVVGFVWIAYIGAELIRIGDRGAVTLDARGP